MPESCFKNALGYKKRLGTTGRVYRLWAALVKTLISKQKQRPFSLSDPPEISSPSDSRRMSAWLSNIPPYLARKWATESDATSTDGDGGSSGSISSKGSSPIGKAAVFRIPATRLGAAAHRGYLDCRNKKKQWER